MAGVTSNASQIVDALDDLRRDLEDLTPANRAAAASVLPLAVERAPRLTGRLAASLRSVVDASGYGVESRLPYAARVHARQPWITDLVDATAADQTRAVEDYLVARIAAT